MATAHLMHGFCGAGKTTFAKKLAEEKGILRLSHDEWMQSLYAPDFMGDKFSECFTRVHDLIWSIALTLLENGTDVIIDHGFWGRDARDEACEKICAIGATPQLYFIDCPKDVMLERVLKRNEDLPPDSVHLDENAFHQFWEERFEPLTEDEPHIHIKTDEA